MREEAKKGKTEFKQKIVFSIIYNSHKPTAFEGPISRLIIRRDCLKYNPG